MKLKVAFQTETTLTSSQISFQREVIRAAQYQIAQLVKSLRDPNISRYVLFSFDAVPYLVVEVDVLGLENIIKSSIVERVYVENPLNPLFGLELERSIIDLDAAYGKPLPTVIPIPQSQKCGAEGCEALLKRAKEKGFIELSVGLRTSKDLSQPSTSDKFEQASLAEVRLVQSAFIQSMKPYIVSVGRPGSYTPDIIGMVVSFEGASFILSNAAVNFVLSATPFSGNPKTFKVNKGQDSPPQPPPNYNVSHVDAEAA